MAVPLITGPTAVGKTDLAVAVAKALGAEIVSCDSRQAYRELNAATAKPDEAARAAVRHHFIDSRSIQEPWSAGQFARDAEALLADLQKRGRSALVVGGSTLYLRALTDGLSATPPADHALRTRLKERLATEGSEALFQELLQCDPAFASSLDPTKSQRIVRGLEVFLGTGRPLSDWHADRVAPRFSYRMVVLTRDRQALYDRIDRRVPAMLDAGLVEETSALMAAGFDPIGGPVRTIGYTEAAGFLAGSFDRDRMMELLRRNTRRYAKRQLTWFRSLPDAAWLELDGLTHEDAVSRILAHVR